MMRRIALTCLLALALAACGENKPDPAAKAAGGEVLEGTISDAMIDLDRSTAEAPIMPHKAVKGDDSDGAGAQDADAGKASGAAPHEAKPAAPAAEAKPEPADATE